MQRAGDGGERESKGVMVSEGTFMTKCKVILWGIGVIRDFGLDHQSNREQFEEFYARSQDYICDF